MNYNHRLLLLLLSCAICSCAKSSAGGDHPPAVVQIVSMQQPEARRVVSGESMTEQKFVQVQINQVDNPNLVRLSFVVHFEPDDGDSVTLGSFALFPPDNPGSFIVATQGKVNSDGRIIVSIKSLDDSSALQAVKVQIDSIKLVDSIN